MKLCDVYKREQQAKVEKDAKAVREAKYQIGAEMYIEDDLWRCIAIRSSSFSDRPKIMFKQVVDGKLKGKVMPLAELEIKYDVYI